MTLRNLALRASVLALGAGLAALSATPAVAACQFQKLAEVPVTMEGMRPTVMTKINGQDARFTIDTGSFFGAVSPEAVTQYGMKHATAPFGMSVKGIGGAQRDIQAVAADNFTFAGVGFRNTEFMVIGRTGGTGTAGIIGENLMGPFDVEYDFANGVMRYFSAKGCGYEANLAYWSQGMSVSRLPIVDPTNILTRIKAYAKVDGRQISVVFDTGAGASILSRPAAARAGVQMTSDGVINAGVSYGIYGKGVETVLAPFSSFKIGDEEIKNTRLRVANLEMGDGDMLLGPDFFLSHRILVSNSQKKIYFTYNGGPVFRLDGAAQQQAKASTPAAPAGDGAAAAAGEPKTGAEFARRAAAEVSRREFQQGIADYGRAIELEPDKGPYYRARGMARLVMRQPLLAMADLDESLKREPNDPEALMRRGQLFLATRDPGRARADFDQAMKLAPNNGGYLIEAGGAYARAGIHEPAIRALDSWVASHPRDEDLPRVLNLRCYARAVWGQELDMALADCDAAMRKDKTSDVMENRGLVLLRMGRLDESIAQFADAVRAQPRSAQALYGRGLAEMKKGEKTEGEADIAAAKALAPNVAQQFQRFGLTPEGEPSPTGARSAGA